MAGPSPGIELPTRRVATKLGCPTGDSKAMKHCLQSKTVAQIQNATNEEGPVR